MDLGSGFTDFLAKNGFGQRGVFRAKCLHKRAKIFQTLAIPLGGTIRVREAESTPAPDAAMKNGEHGSERFALGSFEENFAEIVFCFEHGLRVAGAVRFFDNRKRAIEARDLLFAGLFG